MRLLLRQATLMLVMIRFPVAALWVTMLVVSCASSRPADDDSGRSTFILVATGGARTAAPHERITLDGSGSSAGATPFEELSLTWRLIDQPEGSLPIFENSTTPIATFAGDLEGRYVVELEVSHPTLGVGRASATITVDDGIPDVETNVAPTATTAGDIFVMVGAPATLSGAASTDPEGAALTYRWQLVDAPAGAAAALEGGESVDARLTPDLPGLYTLRLVVSDGALDSAPAEARVHARRPRLSFSVSDAVHSPARDELLLLEDGEPWLHVLEPTSGAVTSIELPLDGMRLAASPGGSRTVVAHDGWVSEIDVAAATVVGTHPVTTTPAGAAVSDDGLVVIVPRVAFGERNLHTIDLATGLEALSSESTFRSFGPVVLHPDGDRLYALTGGSPDDLQRLDMISGLAELGADSPDSRERSLGSRIWASEHGALLLTGRSGAFRTTNDASDMTFAGQLEDSDHIEHVDHAAGVGLFATVHSVWPTTGFEGNEVCLHADDFLTLERTIELPPAAALDGTGSPVRAHFAFFSSDESTLFVLVEAPGLAGSPWSYRVVPLE